MALIALTIIGCIDFLAFRYISTRVMFCPKNKLNVFFFAKKSQDVCREEVLGLSGWLQVFPPHFFTVWNCTFKYNFCVPKLAEGETSTFIVTFWNVHGADMWGGH